jgi:hypothetical protein
MVAVLACVVTTACGHDAPDPQVLHAGQADIRLPPGWKVTDGGATRPARSGAPSGASGDAAAAPGASAKGDTVPLAQDDPQTAFFKSVRVFQGCLDDLGTKFIGVPDQKNPSSPTNDPAYLKDLGTCAAKSNILQALQNVQKAQDAMTPAEIEKQNKTYLKWRDCMTGRGWGIPKPKPDAKGRLFAFGGTSGPPQFTPPPGQDAFSSPDFQDCIEEVRSA